MNKIPIIKEDELDICINEALKGKGLLIGDNNEKQTSGILKFTKKEISQMPTQLRKLFKTPDGVVAHVRKKKNGVIELRCTVDGKRISASGKDLDTARKKFILALKNKKAPVKKTSAKKYLFSDYVQHYLNVFKKPNICERAYNNYTNIIKNHIVTNFQDKTVAEVTATDCQSLLNGLLSEGKGRIAEDVKNLLKWSLSAAVTDNIIAVNPMNSVEIPKHFRKHGEQINAYIIKKYLESPIKNKYDYCFRFLLFTGLRPCELKSIVFENNFITVKDAKKKKNDVQTYRKIPIHSYLMPMLENIKCSITANATELGKHFRKNFPIDHRLYDLRHTFTSRIQECGANKEWVDYITAHKAGKNTTSRIYTHFSEEYSINQMELLHF